MPDPLELWSPVELADIPFMYRCGGLPFPAHAIADGLPAQDADPTITRTAQFGGPGTVGRIWRVLSDDGERVEVATVIDDDPRAEWALYTVNLVRTPEGWDWEGEGDCRPWARFARGLGGYWRLDPRYSPPSPRSRRLHLKVWYEGCHTSVRLRGRPHVAMTDDAVLVAVPVKTTASSDMCIGGPPTRVAVRLPQPLGARELYDAGTLPIRAVAVKRERGDRLE